MNIIQHVKKSKKVLHVNKNNPTKPENLLKKEYTEEFEELKKEIKS